jgi:RNA polymerase sigma-70 factor (ECF subfamily)
MQPAVALPFGLVTGRASSEEGELVTRLRTGNLEALGAAYDAHHEHVRSFARRMVGEDGAAEDLVQETFLTLPRAVARFRGESSLRTFLVSLAVNHARHHVRAAARRRAAAARFGREPRTGVSTPADEAARAELAAALLRALDTLSDDQRAAVVLCVIEERTSQEASLILDVPDATVRTRVFHAKRKLVEALAKEGIR